MLISAVTRQAQGIPAFMHIFLLECALLRYGNGTLSNRLRLVVTYNYGTVGRLNYGRLQGCNVDIQTICRLTVLEGYQ